MIDIREIRTRIADRYAPDELVRILNISMEELLDFFGNFLLEEDVIEVLIDEEIIIDGEETDTE